MLKPLRNNGLAASAILALLAFGQGAAAGEAGEADDLERTMNKLFESSEQLEEQPGSEAPVEFEGGAENPRWFQGLTVAKSENPMLTRQCRKQALNTTAEDLREQLGLDERSSALDEAVRHVAEHQEFIQGEEISYAEYLRSIAECQEFCAPLVASMIQCHVVSVARHPHGPVLFDLGAAAVQARYKQGVIADMIDRYRERDNAQILLVGRASRIGDLRYNRRLSAQRALAVQDELIERGVPRERVRPLWFGWEPPQIDRDVAEEYGIAAMMDELGTDRLNQSVMMVLF